MFREFVRKSKNTINGSGMRQALVYNYPLIDVVVRESIQNSLDALKPDSENLEMSFRTGTFDIGKFDTALDEEDYGLKERFSGNDEFLEIRDRGTFGLDGSPEVSDDIEPGRLTKLVYSFAEKQNEEGKGGSWGYGKTCYFGLGAGFVVYYSRTVYEGEYVSRLAVALVENTDSRDTMIIPESKLGTTYWGMQSSLNPQASVPITDEGEIEYFLSIFGTIPFTDEETGTVVIIPFINTDRLVRDSLERMYDSEFPESGRYDFRKLLFMSVQRWYFPRLLENDHMRPLLFRYNGELLSYSVMEVVFKRLKALYESTFDPSCKTVTSGGIVGERPAVFLATEMCDMSDLALPHDMGLKEMFLNGDSMFNSLGMKCRGTGMIISYDCGSGFVKGVKTDRDDQCVFAIIRVNPSAEVSDRQGAPFIRLEEYIRRGEPPAHDLWRDVDLSKIDPRMEPYVPKVVEKILTNSKSQLDRLYKKKVEREKGRRVGMSRAVGRLLFPDGFFNTSEKKSRSAGSCGGGISEARRTAFSRDGTVQYTESGLIIQNRFSLAKGVRRFILTLGPNVIGEKIDTVEDWETKTGEQFPYEVDSIIINSINGKVMSPFPDVTKESTLVQNICFEPYRHGVAEIVDMVSISKDDDAVKLEVTVTLRRISSSTFPIQMFLREVRDDE